MHQKRKSLLSFLVELLIVFLGVYGAFELNSYQQSKRDHLLEENFYQSFLSELNELTNNLSRLENQLEKRIGEFEESIQNGNRPDLEPVNLYFRESLLITQVGFNEELFIQLDPGLTVSLKGGFDMVKVLEMRIKDFNEICNAQLISGTELDFYDNDGKLKESYEWYLDGLRDNLAEVKTLRSILEQQAIPAVEQVAKEKSNG